MDARPGGPVAKREPSPEGLGLNSEYDLSAVGAALNLDPRPGVIRRAYDFFDSSRESLESQRISGLPFHGATKRRVPHTPDFLRSLVALIHFMRLSSMKAAHVAVA